MERLACIALALTACASNMPGGGDDDDGGPTKLPVDCRTKDTTDMRCQPSVDVPPHTFGKGPNDDYYAYGGGFVDAANNRLVVAFGCDICQQHDTGVMGIDLTTGDRTLLSGAIKDRLTGELTVGNGDAFTSVDDVELAPNGKWWVLDSQNNDAMMHEVDPATGDRTVLYTQAQLGDFTTGICKANGTVLMVGGDVHGESFTSGLANFIVHPDGKIYARAERGGDDAHPPNLIELSAIVELDHGACRVVTSYSAKYPAYDHGSGPGVDEAYGWLAERQGALVSNVSYYYMHAIDIATGNRTTLASADPSALLGSGGNFGGACNAVAPDGNTILSTGNFLAQVYGGIVSIDGDTGDRTTIIPAGGPQRNGDEATVIAHPLLPGVYIMPSLGMVTLFEPATGNSVYLSR